MAYSQSHIIVFSGYCIYLVNIISCLSNVVPMQVTGVHYYLERNSNVRVSWDSPKSETDLDIVQYQVQCLADGKLRIDRRTNITHFEFLFENMNGENTVFRVRAVSVIGSGEWSTPLSITCKLCLMYY